MRPDQPLSDKEFEELDRFLLSDRVPEGAMTMDSLHGFLTAIAIGPESVPLAEWLPLVWGDGVPEFKSEKESDRIVGLMARSMNEILLTFEVAPREFEPLYCEHEADGKMLIDGEAWAWGFWEGMQLRAEAWQPLWDSDLAALMRPIYLLGADEIEEEEAKLVETPLQRHKLALEIEANLPHIQRFWQPRRKSAVQTVTREAPKVGRNDDCPCGSGKKYKKCCGAQSL